MGLSVYDKELLVVLVAVDKWRHYLEGGHFIIKTNHNSLRNLLQQRLHTQLQRKGVSKLLGLDYTIHYRQGKENKVADALSRREEQASCCAITTVVPDWVKEIIESYEHTEWLKDLQKQLTMEPTGSKGYTMTKGLIRYRDRIVVGND